MKVRVGIVLALAFIVIIVVVRTGEAREMSFPEITEGMVDRATKVLDDTGRIIEKAEIIRIYNNLSFHSYHGNKGGTAHRNWTFMDENDTILFILTDIGNRNLIQISINGREKIYQGL